MLTSGPTKARLRAIWHMLRRPGHRTETFYIKNRLVAMHCRDCKRAFYGSVIYSGDVIRNWSVTTPNRRPGE